MIFHPGILALLLGSALTTAMMCFSAYEGAKIIQGWDLRSGSEQQLQLERRTYLISTVMSYAMGFQLLSLFLFIYTADSLSSLFVGAMCAAGSLNVNGFGYPSLIVKIAGCLLAGLWLIINATDNKAHDYPLIRGKYWLLLCMAPVLIADTTLQSFYLLSLKPNIITSCCSILFNTDTTTVMGNLSSLPQTGSMAIFFVSATLVMVLGLNVYLRAKGALLFGLAAFCHLSISIVALISFISIYFYELPAHHCPFCLLHQEYAYIGYFLYAAALVSAIAGMGTAIISHFQSIASLSLILPAMQKKLVLTSLVATAIFVFITGYSIVFSNLSIVGQ